MEKHEASLQKLVEQALPGHVLRSVVPLGDDAHADLNTGKGTGYGSPQLMTVEGPRGPRKLVLHVARPNAFGHNRRSDRAAAQIEAFETFNTIPRHVKAIDLGAFDENGGALSLRHLGEYYLLTEYAEGTLYADKLRSAAESEQASFGDVEECRMLAHYLAELHSDRRLPEGQNAKVLYQRSVRDVVGSGEGILGISDAYASDLSPEILERVAELESRALGYRRKLRNKHERLRRVHGDFHPFNILFHSRSGQITVLDASQGTWGDPAMDVTALCINYLFFGLAESGDFQSSTAPLYGQFLRAYLAQRPDPELLSVAPLYFAFRSLVLCCPAWYPHLADAARVSLLDLALRYMEQGQLDSEAPEQVLAAT